MPTPEPRHVVCPHCHATNRVPTLAMGQAPDCGKCHQPLFTRRPVAVDGAAFERHVARSDLPVLVDFWASWCGPCRMMAPHFEAAAGELEPQMQLLKLDTEAASATAARLQIRSIPTLALFVGGREVARQSGAMSKADIVRWAQSAWARNR